MHEFTIIGAGITGATIARLLADAGKKVRIYEKRDIPSGHASDRSIQGTLVSDFGPHFFHTNNEDVWQFANRFAEFLPLQVIANAYTDHGWVPWPINRETIEKIYAAEYGDSKEEAMKSFQDDLKLGKDLEQRMKQHMDQETFETKAVNAAGYQIYHHLIYNYTLLQWQRLPQFVPPEVFTRIRIKQTYDPLFFDDTYVGIPLRGYTEWIKNMLSHPNITVRYNFQIRQKSLLLLAQKTRCICTAPIDEMCEYAYGELEYLKVKFNVLEGKLAEIACDGWPSWFSNYTCSNPYFTRGIAYHKMRRSQYPVVVLEEPGSGENLYPVRSNVNAAIHAQYRQEMMNLGIICAGRLGAFRYIDMYKAIEEAMIIAEELLQRS